jgi:hypothetical protein
MLFSGICGGAGRHINSVSTNACGVIETCADDPSAALDAEGACGAGRALAAASGVIERSISLRFLFDRGSVCLDLARFQPAWLPVAGFDFAQ